ncbi:hypothetical protein BJV78DRAFT_1281804 [Lactifluus subvellereus]|nr:hypothetical protein BJV78DRAFT_1281804 [Lactifluus subvellereus]
MSTSPPNPENIAEIAAPLLLGTSWNWMLYGVLIVQLYVYMYNFQGDRKLLKLLETLQTALSGMDMYYWFVSGFGNIDHVDDPYLSAFDVPIIGSIVSLTVQFFFAYRVWILSEKKSWWLCMVICVCSLIGAGTAFGGGVYTAVRHKFANGRTLKVLAFTWLISTILADLLIAAMMLYHLTRRRRVGDGYFSDHALSRIVRLTIETNILTTTVAIVSLLIAAIFPVSDSAATRSLTDPEYRHSATTGLPARESRSTPVFIPPSDNGFPELLSSGSCKTDLAL